MIHDHITHLLDSAADAALLANRDPEMPEMIDGEPLDWPWGENCFPESHVDAQGQLRTVWRWFVPRGPQLSEGADVSAFPTRESGEDLLAGGGWLDSLWGPMSAACDWHVRVAAANHVYAQARWPGDSWLHD